MLATSNSATFGIDMKNTAGLMNVVRVSLLFNEGEIRGFLRTNNHYAETCSESSDEGTRLVWLGLLFSLRVLRVKLNIIRLLSRSIWVHA